MKGLILYVIYTKAIFSVFISRIVISIHTKSLGSRRTPSIEVPARPSYGRVAISTYVVCSLSTNRMILRFPAEWYLSLQEKHHCVTLCPYYTYAKTLVRNCFDLVHGSYPYNFIFSPKGFYFSKKSYLYS